MLASPPLRSHDVRVKWPRTVKLLVEGSLTARPNLLQFALEHVKLLALLAQPAFFLLRTELWKPKLFELKRLVKVGRPTNRSTVQFVFSSEASEKRLERVIDIAHCRVQASLCVSLALQFCGVSSH